MRVAAAALALALSAGYASSFIPHPTCHIQNHQISGTGTSPSPPAASHAQLSRLHARPRFKEEDFYFDDEDDFDGDDFDEDDGYYDRSRSAPAARRQRQSPPRQRQRPQREASRRRSDVDIDSPSRRQSSKSKETLGTIALEKERDSEKMKEMTTTGSAAPIVPSRNGRRNNYREEDEDEWDDEDEFDDEYFEDEFDDDYYDDDGDEVSSGGNFWTNPEGGLDPYPSSGAGSRSGRRRKATTRGRMPPSTAEPQPDTKPRGRSRSRSRERSANGRPSDAYGRPPSSRRQPGAIQKTTFRSGTPPPPPLMKDFYDRFFWYGFDPRETTSPTDRTMFGGTKGKFSGLDVLREVDGKPASKRGPHGERMREREEYDEYDDDEWDDFEDEYDDYLDDDFDDTSDKEAIIPKPLLPLLSIEEKRSSRPLPPRSRRRKENRKSRESRGKRNDRRWFDDDEGNDDDQDRPRSGRRNMRERKSPSRNNRRSRKGRFASNSEWASNEVSSWFTDDDDGDVIDLWPSRKSNEDEDDEYWRDDSFEQPVSRRNARSRRGRKGDRRSGRRREDDTPPVLTFVESIFGMDSRYIDEKAREYEEKIGRAKPSSSTRSSRRGRPARNEVSRRRRSGYAYRYEDDDDDDSPPVAEFAPARDSADVLDVGMGDSNADNVIDVPAGIVIRRDGSASTRQTKKRRRKRPSWEDRESEELDRIPPAGITAYGPEGDVMGGIDARTFAALKASEEIREAKRKVAKREERVVEAEERILMLKADVEEQTRIFSQSRQRNSPRVRDAKRQMNMMVEDAARLLRKARAELDVAVEAMEDLEDRHWVLLSQVASDEEFARLDAEAEREEEGEGVASMVVDDDIFNDDDDSEDDDNGGVDTLTTKDDQPEDEVQVEILPVSAESKGETAENAEMQGDEEKDSKQPKSDE